MGVIVCHYQMKKAPQGGAFKLLCYINERRRLIVLILGNIRVHISFTCRYGEVQVFVCLERYRQVGVKERIVQGNYSLHMPSSEIEPSLTFGSKLSQPLIHDPLHDSGLIGFSSCKICWLSASTHCSGAGSYLVDQTDCFGS